MLEYEKFVYALRELIPEVPESGAFNVNGQSANFHDVWFLTNAQFDERLLELPILLAMNGPMTFFDKTES